MPVVKVMPVSKNGNNEESGKHFSPLAPFQQQPRRRRASIHDSITAAVLGVKVAGDSRDRSLDNLRLPPHHSAHEDEIDAADSALMMACNDPNVTLASLREAAGKSEASNTDAFGMTPLHWLCLNPSATPTLINELHKFEPGAIRAQTTRDRTYKGEAAPQFRKGETPLHLIMRNPNLVSSELLPTLVALDPSIATMRNKVGDTLLHLFCGHNPNVNPETLKCVLALDSASAVVRNKFGETPLHKFCHFNPNVNADSLAHVLALNPSAATARSNFGTTSLHYFCGFNYNVNAKILKCVVALETSAANARDKFGNTAMHYFCTFNPNVNTQTMKVMLSLLDNSAATSRNKLGSTPLHAFCQYNPNMNTATLGCALDALAADSTVLNVRDLQGTTPLQNLRLDAMTHVQLSGDGTLQTRKQDPVALARVLVERGPETAFARVGKHIALHYFYRSSEANACNTIKLLGTWDHNKSHNWNKHNGRALKTAHFAVLPHLLLLPTRTMERVAAEAFVTKRVNSALTSCGAVRALCSEGSTLGVIPLFGIFMRVSFVVCRPTYEKSVLGPHVGSYFAPRVTLWALAGVGVLISVGMVCSRLRVAYKMRCAGLLSVWSRDTWNLLGLFSPAWAGTVLLVGCVYHHTCATPVPPSVGFTQAAALGVVLLGLRLLSWIRLWLRQFAMFVSCLGMIFYDLIPFIVVSMVVLVSFAWAFLLLASSGDTNAMFVSLEGSTAPASTIDNGVSGMLDAFFRPVLLQAFFAGLLVDGDGDWLLTRGVGTIIFAVCFFFVVSLVMLNVLIAVVSDAYEAAMVRALAVYHRMRLQLAAEILLAPPLHIRWYVWLLIVWSLWGVLWAFDPYFSLHFVLFFLYFRIAMVLYYAIVRHEMPELFNLIALNHYLTRHLRFTANKSGDDFEDSQV